MGMEELDDLVKKFNRRAAENMRLSKEISELKRKIIVKFNDDGKYYLLLENSMLSFTDPFEKADIEVELDTETFHKILGGEMDALSAYITRKISVKASLSDKLLLSDLLKK